MTLSKNSSFGGGSTAVQGQGGGLGQQGDVLNSGSSVNQGGFSLTDGLKDMLNGFDWSSLANYRRLLDHFIPTTAPSHIPDEMNVVGQFTRPVWIPASFQWTSPGAEGVESTY
ncbi:hypothetical protein AAC387_Pa11g2055 [Persea americana]